MTEGLSQAEWTMMKSAYMRWMEGRDGWKAMPVRV